MNDETEKITGQTAIVARISIAVCCVCIYRKFLNTATAMYSYIIERDNLSSDASG